MASKPKNNQNCSAQRRERKNHAASLIIIKNLKGRIQEMEARIRELDWANNELTLTIDKQIQIIANLRNQIANRLN